VSLIQDRVRDTIIDNLKMMYTNQKLVEYVKQVSSQSKRDKLAAEESQEK